MTLQRIAAGRGHWYKIDGQKVDGVTTLIKDGLPKPALMYWSARTVAEYVADNLDQVASMADMGRASIVAALKEVPWTKRDQAAAKGTEVHAYAERLARGEEVDVPDHIAGYVESAVAFLDDYRVTTIQVEAAVGSRRWRYAGTADLIAAVTLPNGQRVRAVLDYKTAASGIWPDVSLQLAAYRNADVYLDADGREQQMAALSLAETAYAVWLRADGYDVHPVDVGEQPFKTFQHMAYVARRTRKDGAMSGWLSPALPAVTREEITR